MQDEQLVEQVAREICRDGGSGLCVGFCHSERCMTAIEQYERTARAIIPIVQASTFDLVESHLSACAYDPAPYTAMKYRLAAIRKEPTDGR